MFFKDSELDDLLEEDVPYFDLTTFALGLSTELGKICYVTRENCIVSGTEEVARMFEKLEIRLLNKKSSGDSVEAGTILIEGEGAVSQLNKVWKVGQNLLDNCCGIATKTYRYRQILEASGSKVVLLTTRKGFPGTKKLATKAILAGGAYPHRLGVSETVLVFQQHLNFLGGMSGFLEQLPKMRRHCCEKKIIVEVGSLEEAWLVANAGVDGIQVDKMPVEVLADLAVSLKRSFPQLVILAAGGIRENNLEAYGKCEIDGIVTTSLYDAPPIDLGVKIFPISQ